MLSTLEYGCELLHKSALQIFRVLHSKCPPVWNQLSLDHSPSSSSVTDQNLLLFHEEGWTYREFLHLFSPVVSYIQTFKSENQNWSSRQRMLSEIRRDNEHFLKKTITAATRQIAAM